jgi:predicted enzyme related to lactoylglutathione lyase
MGHVVRGTAVGAAANQWAEEADMAEATAVANKPAWVDLASDDPEGSRAFYAKLFGWDIHVAEDPQYGGYAIAQVEGRDVAGIGPKQSPQQPTVWSVYIGTSNADELAERVTAAGGTVVAPPFDVGDQGRMAVFQDPTGAYISAWQPAQMEPFLAGKSNTFGWAELNARGVDKAIAFYQDVFGWTVKRSEMGEGAPVYNEFQLDGESIAGAMELNPQMPPEVPSYWMAYFAVNDVDASHQQAIGAGAREMLPPQDFPGGRFSILNDPQGAMFGLLRMSGA